MSIASKKSGKVVELVGESIARLVGLCSTCVNNVHCVMLKTRSAPIWFCEEFDDFIPYKAEAQKPLNVSAATRVWSPGISDSADARTGLCANCDNHGSCVLRTIEGPMYCEEYR